MSRDLHESFMRQRRNLISMEIIVSLYYLADLRFTKFNILGNEVIVGKPEYITKVMWILLIYWFIRFAQYFVAINDNSYRQVFNEAYDKRIGKLFIKILNGDAEKRRQWGVVDGVQKVARLWGINTHNNEAMWAKSEITYYVSHQRSGDTLAERKTALMGVEGIKVLPVYIAAMFKSVMLSPYFTEYWIPVLLFITTVFIALYRWVI